MGLLIDRSTFSEEDYETAAARLHDNLAALKLLFDREDFGRGPASLGAELEMSIVDDNSHALPLNRQILADSVDPNLQLELNRFNLEYNLSPVAAAGSPFSVMRSELERALDVLGTTAARHGGRVAPIGILPTLTLDDLQSGVMTDLHRYRALQFGIQRIRQHDFHIRIDGDEPLDLEIDSVTVEGANTSFQLHMRVDPDDFADFYNAAQLATPLALAVGANSPFLLGHSLWDETRIALFKQAVDTRGPNSNEWRRAARVPFGHGWVRDGPYELFAESCHLYPILLPVFGAEDPIDIVANGGIPKLQELRLHQGTIWNWNRPVYDAADGGHVRIELRALPSGPTPIDMMASGAFLIGLTAGLSRDVNELLPAFPFRYAEYNFYRAAQKSLQAELLWPTLDGNSPRTAEARALCRDFVDVADEGLGMLGVDADERSSLLGEIRARLDSGTTPAAWQRRRLARYSRMPRDRALVRVLEDYLTQVETGRPVSTWD